MTFAPREALALPNPAPAPALLTTQVAADPLSFSTLFQVLRRHYRLFGGVVATCLLLSALLAAVLPARYTAEARLMIDPHPRESPVTSPSRTSAAPDTGIVETEVDLIGSPSVARSLVQRLGLSADPEFADTKARDAVQGAAERLLRRVNINREGLTYVVAIRARSRDPQKATRIANGLAEEYLSVSKAQRAQMAADQAKTLSSELVPLGKQVIEADQKVADFRATHGIVNSPSGDARTLTEQEIATVAGELGKATADAAAAHAAAVGARAQASSGGTESISQVLNSDSLRELRDQRAQVLREQAQISTVYGPQHPASRRIDDQLTRLNNEIRTAAKRVVTGLESDDRAAQSRVASLQTKLAALEGRQTLDSKAAVVANSLQRNADAARDIYNDLSRKTQEQAQEARIGDVRAWLVSPAVVPLQRSFPRTSIFLTFGLVIGTALGTGAVVAAELRRRGFRSAEELEAELQSPFIASIPELSGPRGLLERASPGGPDDGGIAPWDYVLERPTSSFAEALRNIRATLLAGDPRPGKAICVTSAVAGEGKTTVAVSLARTMAMCGDRVLLLEGDFRIAGLAGLRARAGDPRQPNVIDVLEGRSRAVEALVEDVTPGLSVLALSAPAFTSRDVFSGSRPRQVLNGLKAHYDFIIIDAPPVLAVADALTLSALCDATLLVVRHDRTERSAVKASIERLQQIGARLHGVVLNRLNRAHSPRETGYYEQKHNHYYLN